MATEYEIRQAINYLLEFFELPRGRALEDVVTAWQGEFRKVEGAELTLAVEHARRHREYWPKPTHLWGVILDQRRANPKRSKIEVAFWEWERGGRYGPCPVCGSVHELTRADRRSGVWHDHQRHLETKVPYVGPRTGLAVKGCMAKHSEEEGTPF